MNTHLVPLELPDFLDRYVEGYLFNDLHSMAAISLPAGQTSGAVDPMVATAVAGIELFGVLKSLTTFERGHGALLS